jgi:hypothetical protein
MLDDCSMLDLIRSCDVLFTKPGYGAFTEAVLRGTASALRRRAMTGRKNRG